MASGEPRRQIPDSAVYSRDDIEYDESDFLGSGAYSEVFEGRLKHKGPSGDHDGTSTTVAVKVLVDKRQRKEAFEFLLREAGVLLSLPKHKNIINCFGISQSPNFFALLFECVKGDTLSNLLKGGGGSFCISAAPAFEKWENRLDICHQISFGMAFLHSHSVVHFDLKPQNVLLELTSSGEFICKISDFGLAKIRTELDWTQTGTVFQSAPGTLCYMSPERLGGVTKSSSERVKSDVYSFGVIMWMVREKKTSLDISVTPEIIRAGLPLPREGNPAPIGYSKVMRHCIAYQPHDRPSFDQLIDEFFKMSAADLKLEVEKPQDDWKNLVGGRGLGRARWRPSTSSARKPGSPASTHSFEPTRSFEPNSFEPTRSFEPKEPPIGEHCVLLFGLPPKADQKKVIEMVERVIDGKILKYWGAVVEEDSGETKGVRVELQSREDVFALWKYQSVEHQLQYDNDTAVTIDIDSPDEYELDKFLISGITREVSKDDLAFHVQGLPGSKRIEISKIEFVADRTRAIVFLKEPLVDKKMVDKLNRSGREFEGDKEKIRLEFSRIPANLDVEVLNLPPDVNPTRLRRFFFALRSAPLVKDIIVSPEKENAFVVKLRTESDVQGVISGDIPEIGGVRPRLRRYSQMPSEDSSETDMYSGQSEDEQINVYTSTFTGEADDIVPEVITFIWRSGPSRRALEQLGDIFWNEEDNVLSIQSRGKRNDKISPENEQKWQEETRQKFFKVYDDFIRRSLNMTSLRIFQKMAEFAKKENANKGNEITIQEDLENQTLFFIGEKAQVGLIYGLCSQEQSLLAKDEKIITKAVTFPSIHHLDLFHSTINVAESLDIFLDRDSLRIFIKGPAYLVEEEKETFANLVSNMNRRKIFLPSAQDEFFCFGGVEELTALLLNEEIQAVATHGSPHLQFFAMNEKEMTKAINVHNSNFTTEDVLPSDKENLLLMQSAEMGGWIKEQCSKSSSKVLAKGFGKSTAKEFSLTGSTKRVRSVVHDCYVYLAKNTMYETCRQLRGNSFKKFIARYYWKHFKSLAEKLKEYNADVRVCEGAREPQLVMKATKGGIIELEKTVDKQLMKMKMDNRKFKRHGLSRYVAEGSFEQERKKIQTKNSVVITVGADEDWMNYAQPKSSFVSAYASSKAPLKRICLYTGDICEHRADAIVNAANEALDHGSGLAAHIVKCAGAVVQEESTALLTKLPLGRLATGHAVSTSPGKLRTTKCVIHAVGPRWEGMHQSQDSKRLLQDAVYESMKIASESNFSSIAFPAISAGIFGGLSAVVADVMVEAVGEFFSNFPQTSLESVDFVMRLEDADNVHCFRSSLDRVLCRVCCARAPSSVTASATRSVAAMAEEVKGGAAVAGASVAEALGSTKSSFVVKVKSGDITKQKANAIINPSNEDMDLTKGETAKAISKAAGPQLHDDCRTCVQKGGPLKPGAVRVTPGHGLSASFVLHAYSSQTVQDIAAVVHACLMEASELELTKVAFPALGTGEMNFDVSAAAEAFFAGIQRFHKKRPLSSIQKIVVVIYKYSNLSAYQRASKKFTSEVTSIKVNNETMLSMSKENRLAPNEASLSNGCNFTIDYGDIINEKTDAIIATEGVVWEAVQNAFPLLKAEWEKRKKQSPRFPIEFPSSPLNAPHIYLISPSKYESSLSNANNAEKISSLVEDCLSRAEKAGHSSIALPAVGTARLLFSNALSARAIIDGARSFAAKAAAPSLQRIRLIVFESSRLNEIETEFQKHFPCAPEEFTDSDELPKSFFRSTVIYPEEFGEIPATEPEVVFVTVVGASKESCTSALKSVQEVFDKACIVHDVKMDLPNQFEKEELDAIAAEFRVSLAVSIVEGKRKISFAGIESDAIKAAEKVTTRIGVLLREENYEAEVASLAHTCGWIWVDVKGRSALFCPEENRELELAYHAYRRAGSKKATCCLKLLGDEGTVDFSAMKLKLKKEEKNIKRRTFDSPGHANIPLSWTIYRINEGHKLVSLPSSNVEYERVSQHFLSTLGTSSPPKIQKIERVENPDLYAKFEQAREAFEKKRKKDLANKRAILEKELFHGTAPTDSLKDPKSEIVAHGFNRSFAGTTTVYILFRETLRIWSLLCTAIRRVTQIR
ncbi:protein mono-ADP-ribosyltransferase PARP14-like isoform X2 [Oscarella lobularis]|uniref:protein mono-ADP-ribosyltransferase PARP14-like isoform X2 n=1 Tax=Oscarella lobularis TaxID=121494 RepID=UPI003313A317